MFFRLYGFIYILAHIEVDNADLASVICLTNCQHKVHLACLKWSTPDMAQCLKCPTCASISGMKLVLFTVQGFLNYGLVYFLCALGF